MIVILKIGASSEAEDISRENVTAEDYTVLIKGFPKQMPPHELEIELWD